jgi:hypothetical protein
MNLATKQSAELTSKSIHPTVIEVGKRLTDLCRQVRTLSPERNKMPSCSANGAGKTKYGSSWTALDSSKTPPSLPSKSSCFAPRWTASGQSPYDGRRMTQQP